MEKREKLVGQDPLEFPQEGVVLEHLPAEVKGDVLRVDDTHDELEVGRDELLGVGLDEHATGVEREAEVARGKLEGELLRGHVVLGDEHDGPHRDGGVCLKRGYGARAGGIL